MPIMQKKASRKGLAMPTKKVDRPKKQIHYAVCPFCGMNRVVHKKGSRAMLEHKPLDVKEPGRIVFGAINVRSDPFIDIRIAVGGTTGFKRAKTFSLPEVIKSGVYKDFEDQIRNQCIEVLDVLGYEASSLLSAFHPLPQTMQNVPLPFIDIDTLSPLPKIEKVKALSPEQIKGYFTDMLIATPMRKEVFKERYAGLSIQMPSGGSFSTDNIDLGILYDEIMREVNKMPKQRVKTITEMSDDEFDQYIKKHAEKDNVEY